MRRFDRVRLKNKPVLALLNAKLFPRIVLEVQPDASKTNLAYYPQLADFLPIMVETRHDDDVKTRHASRLGIAITLIIQEALKEGRRPCTC